VPRHSYKNNKGRIVILSGPSGSGKTTLHKHLLLSRRLKGKLVKSVSLTTRARRPGEKNGRDYIFVSRESFFQKRRSGYFLEWKKVFDNYYGTPKQTVRKLLEMGRNVLLCIDVKGAQTVLKRHKDALSIFIKAPSVKALKARLQKRGSETKDNLALRLTTAKQELKKAKQYNYVVINDSLNHAVKKLELIVDHEVKKEKK
jgi:guanylate kinase